MSTRNLLESKRIYLNSALELLCFKLQLPEDQYKLAKSTYGEVSDWLGAKGSSLFLHSPHLFHQGSMLLGTTLLPYGQVQFDLDVICCLRNATNLSPSEVYRLVYSRMSMNPLYRDRIDPKPRCIRLSLSKSFHLDLVPAVVTLDGPKDAIRIPLATDRNAKWKDSHPTGFGGWFAVRCALVKDDGVRKFSCNMSESARIDPMPDQEPFHVKKILKRAVQLIKRWRDHTFRGRLGLSTPSIVVTMLAGKFYDGEQDLYFAVKLVMDSIYAYLLQGKPRLYNPAHPGELISEKWEDKPESFDAFLEAVAEFRLKWEKLAKASGLKEVGEIMTELFGDVVAETIREVFSDIDQAKSASSLRMATSTRTLVTGSAASPALGASISVRGHTFFGD